MKKNPPQKIRITSHGEINKTFLVGILTVGLVIIVMLLIFSYAPTTGKATANNLMIASSASSTISSSSKLPEQSLKVESSKVESSFWEKYKVYLISIPAIMMVLVMLLVIVLHHFQNEKVVYNHDELKDWIRQEREAGSADRDIRKMLVSRTGWDSADVNKMFFELDEKKTVG